MKNARQTTQRCDPSRAGSARADQSATDAEGVVNGKPCAVSLREAARRLGRSYQTARRQMALGTFPVPALPRHHREMHRFSERDIDRFILQLRLPVQRQQLDQECQAMQLARGESRGRS